MNPTLSAFYDLAGRIVIDGIILVVVLAVVVIAIHDGPDYLRARRAANRAPVVRRPARQGSCLGEIRTGAVYDQEASA